jgi:hypothetical protein
MDRGVGRHGGEREREKGERMRKRSVRKGKGERGAIAAEGGEVTAEEKRGSECERDRFTIYARRLLLGICRPLPFRYPRRSHLAVATYY